MMSLYQNIIESTVFQPVQTVQELLKNITSIETELAEIRVLAHHE